MTRELTEAQEAYSRSGTYNMSKVTYRRAQQIASQRSFTYDGSLVPTCLKCGKPREDRRGLKCEACR